MRTFLLALLLAACHDAPDEPPPPAPPPVVAHARVAPPPPALPAAVEEDDVDHGPDAEEAGDEVLVVAQNDHDTDSDSIPDVDDKCPDSPEDIDGFEDNDGCPDPDHDSDPVVVQIE